MAKSYFSKRTHPRRTRLQPPAPTRLMAPPQGRNLVTGNGTKHQAGRRRTLSGMPSCLVGSLPYPLWLRPTAALRTCRSLGRNRGARPERLPTLSEQVPFVASPRGLKPAAREGRGGTGERAGWGRCHLSWWRGGTRLRGRHAAY
jgi:hypothetical protein